MTRWPAAVAHYGMVSIAAYTITHAATIAAATHHQKSISICHPLSRNDLHHKWTCVSAFTDSPGAFPVSCFGWQELDGFIADAKRFFSVHAHICVVVCRVVEKFAGRGMDCYVVSSDGICSACLSRQAPVQ